MDCASNVGCSSSVPCELRYLGGLSEAEVLITKMGRFHEQLEGVKKMAVVATAEQHMHVQLTSKQQPELGSTMPRAVTKFSAAVPEDWRRFWEKVKRRLKTCV